MHKVGRYIYNIFLKQLVMHKSHHMLNLSGGGIVYRLNAIKKKRLPT